MMQMASQPGRMKRMISLLPGGGKLKPGQDIDAESSARMIGMIDSMTPKERRNSKLIDPKPPQPDRRGIG